MIVCKHCSSERVVKDGLVKNKQRYLCKYCAKTFRLGDDRERYTLAEKLEAIKLYVDGVGMMTIERNKGISTPLLIHWIRKFGNFISKALISTKIPSSVKDIEILELDELFTYYQKKNTESLRMDCY